MNCQHSWDHDQNFSKKLNDRRFPGGGGGGGVGLALLVSTDATALPLIIFPLNKEIFLLLLFLV